MEPLKPREAVIFVDGARLSAELSCPERREGLIVFAWGDDGSRSRAHNHSVAHTLQAAGFATLLCDLWTPQERTAGELPCALEELAHRLQIVSNWAETHEALRGLPLGYFGADTGAAAALQTASTAFNHARAIVARSGRLDLVSRAALAHVRAATLLIVGDRDPEAVTINRSAAAALRCTHRIAVVPGASRLFEERASFERLAGHSRRWFQRHLLGRSYRPPIAEEASVE